MKKINELKAQIKDLKNKLSESKIVNQDKFRNKIKILKIELKREIMIYDYENYVSN